MLRAPSPALRVSRSSFRIPHSPLRVPSSYAPHTLRHELRTRGRLPLDECLQLGLALTSALERVKGQVSGQQFQVFDPHVLQHLPVADTARTLRVSAASVYMAKYRVGSLLKKELRKLELSLR